MNDANRIAQYALRTMAACNEPACVTVYRKTVLKLASGNGFTVGVKNTDGISTSFKEALEAHHYYIHTIDAMAHGGRAVDLNLLNPITGMAMTGSSSGTAINVFKGINDLGVGTDGGGSVLAPALALNLYAIMSPLLDKDHKRKEKRSTDGLVFTPSLGLMGKTLAMIQTCFEALVPLTKDTAYTYVFAKSKQELHQELNLPFAVETMSLSYNGMDRRYMMEELAGFDFDNNILVTCEGPIDVCGIGDSVMGHYDALTQSMQSRGHKYYLKVANMLGLTAIITPSKNHARGRLILCKSEPAAISRAFELAAMIPFTRSQLEERTFDCINEIGEDSI